jgi:hypothetical protein
MNIINENKEKIFDIYNYLIINKLTAKNNSVHIELFF